MSEGLYDKVNALWTTYPPITREEAVKAAKRIRKRFKMFPSRAIRRCWISLEGRRLDKGWPRLVHDLSHRHARQQFPRERPHGPHHAAIEHEMIQYVLSTGWLEGKLRPKAPPPVTTNDKLQRLLRRKASWEAKERRAANALKKLARQIRYYERKVA
jgi:hypothetical protein